MGECKKCGECCKWVYISSLKTPEIDDEWCKGRGIIYDIKGAYIIFKIPLKCKYLTEDNLCSIHDHKPDVCNSFPEKTHRFLIPEECRYYDAPIPEVPETAD